MWRQGETLKIQFIRALVPFVNRSCTDRPASSRPSDTERRGTRLGMTLSTKKTFMFTDPFIISVWNAVYAGLLIHLFFSSLNQVHPKLKETESGEGVGARETTENDILIRAKKFPGWDRNLSSLFFINVFFVVSFPCRYVKFSRHIQFGAVAPSKLGEKRELELNHHQ